MEKLKSRKLWAAVIVAALTALGKQLGLTEDQIHWIVTVAVGYILGQGAVDAAKAAKNK